MEIDIQKKDFDKLLFEITLLSENSNVFKVFPQLEKWDEFVNCGLNVRKFNKVFQWIVLVYDQNSPFRSKIEDVIQRKIEVGKYVKLFSKTSEIDDDIKKILLNQNKKVNRMIIAYARMHRNSKYSLVIGLENKFYEDLLTSQNGGKPSAQIQHTQSLLEKAITELLSGDKTQSLHEEFYEYIEDERIDNIRPEDIAKLLAEGKEPVTEEQIY